MIQRLSLAVVLAAIALAGVTPAAPRARAAAETLLAAGDIAACTSAGDEATADLLDTLAGTIVTLGDNAYESGTAPEFANCYDPSWGAHKGRTRPSPGNHDYGTAGAAGYYGYFGAAAGDPAKGYYSFEAGAWHVIAINSNCGAIGGCGAGSPQEQWLRADLQASGADCTLAYWHHPRFSSGPHGNSASMQAIWQALYDYRAEIVLSGHDHTYERFAPQTPSGAADPAYGIREFVVGTGGRSHYAIGTAAPNSEVRNGDTYGVLQLTLDAGTYAWEFVPVAGATFTDGGAGACVSGDWDADDDLVFASDNCPDDANPGQENNDRDQVDLGPSKAFDDMTWPASDTLGDACDADDDNDGLSDALEAASPCPSASGPTPPLQGDADGDRVLDGAECDRSTDPLSAASTPPLAGCQATADGDADGVADARESCYYNSRTDTADSDGDGLDDQCEIASVDGDRTVTVLDLQQVALHMPQGGGQPYLVHYDVTKDGVINVIDLQYTAQRFAPCP